jgi:APA family basic amino acid/polyamine antiporter
MLMKKEKDLSGFKRFVMPSLAILSCLFMVTAAIFSQGMTVVWYLVIFVVIMLIGVPFSKPRKLDAGSVK